MRVPSRIKVFAALGVTMALTSACLSSGSSSSSGGGKPEGEVKGSTVTIWASMDKPVIDGLAAGLAPLAQAAGVTVKWQRVDNINQVIMTKIQANDVPDIAMIPQPGVVADIVNRNKATALDDVVDVNALKSSMLPGALESGTVNGKLYGLLVSANTKSFVWYPKKAWDAAGYKAPQTIDELNALTEKIKTDKTATNPWCMGIESAAATGWPATDWFEDLVMRYGGTDQYNQWVKHQIKFDSPLVRQAAAEFEKIAFTDGNVLGGRKAIASNAFGTAGNPMFTPKPGCMLFKQGSFITGAGFFPKNVQSNLAENVGVFYFPPAQAGGEKPILGGGDMAVLLKNTAGARAVMKMLGDKSIGEKAMGTSFLSPHKDFDVTKYQGETAQEVAKITYASSIFLFDGSDQMPGAVGAGTFWKDMTSWISGQENLDTALKNIDNSWPS
jgi:ABC-type glycerol-3-phosphate transport system substrate-binding protein